MEAERHEPRDRGRAEAENERKRAGKGLILVVTMLPQTVTAMVSMVPPVMANQIAMTLGLSAQVAGLYVALVYVGAVISSSFTASLITRLGPLRTSFACVVGGGLGLCLMAVPHPAAALLATAIIGLSYGPLTRVTAPHRRSPSSSRSVRPAYRLAARSQVWSRRHS